MSLAEYRPVKVLEFGGAWNRTDIAKIPYPNALIALNCEFAPGEVRERKGFGQLSVNLSARSMYCATTSLGVSLFVLGDAGGSVASMALWALTLPVGGVIATTNYGSVTGIGAVFAQAGVYTLCALFTGLFVGAQSAKILLHYAYGGETAFADDVFMGPITDKPTLTSPAAGGVVTAGTHLVGYLIQSRTGFAGHLSPTSSSTQLFDTTSSVVVVAGDKIDSTMTITWPTDAALVYPVMTTIDNLERFFIVPGLAPVAVTGGASETVHFVIDVSDADLVLGTDVTDNASLLVKTTSGTAPILPFSVGAYGDRTVWLAEVSNIGTAYISEPSQAQVITQDQHALKLPGGKTMRCQGVGGKTLYILGPHWTYAFEDTGQIPVLWPPPRLVDGSVGTLSPHGFTIDASTGVGWCAHSSGLYYFAGGSFAQIPISYYSHGDWSRINWATGLIPTLTLPRSHQVMVMDDKTRSRVIVMCALDGKCVVSTSGTAVTLITGDKFPLSGPVATATLTNNIIINGVFYTISSVTDQTHLVLTSSAGTQSSVSCLFSFPYPTHLLVYDYSEGTTPGKVKYSPWQIKTYVPGCITAVASPAVDDHVELWTGEWATATGDNNFLRQMGTTFDASPYSDNGGLAITFQYEPAVMPNIGEDIGAVYHHYAQSVRATGSGSLSRTLFSIDRTSQVTINDITLNTGPGKIYTSRFAVLRSEAASVRFSMSTANSYCIISGLEHYYGLGPRFRAA